MVTLNSYLIWQIISFILPLNEYVMCILLNNAGKYCDITLKIMVMLQNVSENCVRILEEEKHRQLCTFVSLWKKWKKLASSSINQSVRILEEEKHRQLRMFVILWKKWKKLTSSSINQNLKSEKKTHTPENIAAVAESVCEAPSTSIHRRP